MTPFDIIFPAAMLLVLCIAEGFIEFVYNHMSRFHPRVTSHTGQVSRLAEVSRTK